MAPRRITILKSAVWIVCLSPLARMIAGAFSGGLGANPIEYITLSTGTWTLGLLMATLSVTPLRKLTGIPWLIRFRRLLGLFAFFYGVLHFVTYVWLDKFFDAADILKDVARRPFITAGFVAFLLMIPLAATSTSAAIRRLGRSWQLLHRLVYASAAAGVIHFWWKVKADIREPAIYAVMLGLLLSVRAVLWLRSRQAAHPTGAGRTPPPA